MLILSLIIFTMKLSYAQECNPHFAHTKFDEMVRNRQIKTLSKNDMSLGPTRDQDSLGYCYAYAASDLVEHWAKKNNHMPTWENVSAMSLALATQDQNLMQGKGSLYIRAKHKELNLKLLEQSKEQMNTSLAKVFDAEDEIKAKEANMIKQDKRYDQIAALDINIDLLDSQAFEEGEITLTENGKNKIIEDPIEYSMQLTDQRDQMTEKLINELRTTDDYKSKMADLLDKLEKNSKDYAFHLGAVNEIQNQLEWQKLGLLGSGKIEDAVSALSNYFCFESEINSRDENLEKLFNDHLKKLKRPNVPADFESSFTQIILGQYELDEPNRCFATDLIAEIFPAASVQDIQAVTRLYDEAKESNNLFKTLLERSCKGRKIAPPKINEVVYKDGSQVVTKLAEVEKQIEKNLRSGRVLGVNYHAKLFLDNDVKNHKDDKHASVIVGQSLVCGDKYLVIRNSWGKNACKSASHRYAPHPADLKKVNQLKSALKNCIKVKQDNKTTEISAIKSCEAKYIHLIRQASKQPYFCDKKGNFIIKQDYFLKGIDSVEILTN